MFVVAGVLRYSKKFVLPPAVSSHTFEAIRKLPSPKKRCIQADVCVPMLVRGLSFRDMRTSALC